MSTQKNNLLKLNQVTLGATHIEKSFDFYKRLGLHPIVKSPHYARFVVPGNEATLSIHLNEKVNSTTVVYFEMDDLDQKVAELQDRGIKIDELPIDQTWHWREAHLLDPDGNRVCLYHAGEARINPDWRIPESKNQHFLSEEAFKEWLEAYKKAWESRKPESVLELFTEDAEYFETPFGTPSTGKDKILEYWQNVPMLQRNIHFDYQIISVQNDTGYCRWQATFIRENSGAQVALDGIFQVEFAPSGSCQVFREWWHRRES